MKYCVCTDAVFMDKADILSAMEQVKECGYDAIEFWTWWDKDMEAVIAKQQELGLEVATFCAKFIEPGDDRNHDEYEESLKEAIGYAKRMNCKTLIAQAGWVMDDIPFIKHRKIIVYAMRGSTQPEIVVRSDSMVEAIKKNSKVTVIEEESENQDDQNVARRMTENQFNANPDIDVIIACNAESALGAESFIMSSDSPIADMSKFGIFCVDETEEIDAKILASLNNESALRGTISMGGIPDTVADFMKGLTPILTEQEPIPRIDGSIFPINGDNIEEHMASNK